MKFLVWLAILVCVSMKIDAFPQENLTPKSESPSNTVSNVPKVESAEPIKPVENKTGVQSASPVEQSSVPVPVPMSVPSEQKETPTINTDASKQINGTTSSVASESKVENSNDVKIKPKEDNLTEIKNVDDVSKKGSDPDSIGSVTEKPSVENNDDSFEDCIAPDMSGEAAEAAEPESSEEDKDNSANVSGSHQYLNVKDLIQRIQERIRKLMQQMRNRFEIEKTDDISSEYSESDEARDINFPSFSIYNNDELQ